ncbi:acyl-CoA carboxylase epsilon subunit [Streptomyces yaizuensis]|uniref:Acyl-CoA carboxylase subunit epsilon n=1 Tax=Streptomyces yaizuensis TaxID=2989713 RepID=A0ABQ5NVA3_9ACTN|nr:acyl-CoA carboxylase epsilon subunit [Streptomyces sp. YSPA8]GLF94287.1 acyl-CoA carboxylase subunit epsilon [Streptomyces sp. YSPA8]
MIRVVRGNPTPEELAAALAVVRARAVASASGADSFGSGAPGPEQWSDPARIARRPGPRPGPRAWARTYWPG